MNCHSETWAVAPALEPVRESYRTGKSIQWMPLHDLPQFVSFNHSVHVHEGTGCSECHGRVDRMPLTWQERRRQSRFADSGVHRHSFDCLHISGLDDASCQRHWRQDRRRYRNHWRQDRRRYRKMLAFTGSAAKVGP